jgi:ABC-2 type transport system permease protein
MRVLLSDIYWVAWREMHRYLLQRARIAASLVQPTVWLVLVGGNLAGLTREASGIPLPPGGYLAFMTPGIMVMTALFGGVFGGTSVLWDRRLGILNKMLAAPIRRASIPLGKLAALMVQSWLQVLVILIVAWMLGVRIVTGLPGALCMILIASIFGVTMGALSLALAARIKSIETLFAITNFIALPLIFTSNAIFPATALPSWVRAIALINPVTYAVTPMRVISTLGWYWAIIWPSVLILSLMATASVALAISQFRRAQ